MSLSAKSLLKKRQRKEAKRLAKRKEIHHLENIGKRPKMNEQQRHQLAIFKRMIEKGEIYKDEKTGQYVKGPRPVENTAIPVDSNSNPKA
jgi:hypothetical protein